MATRLADAVRRALDPLGDPARAAGQQAYLKSAMPLRGVRMADLRAVLRPVLSDPAYVAPTRTDWAAAVRELWDEAEYRDDRYAALEVSGARAYRGYQDQAALPLYEHLVVTGAWWDLVDPVASGRVGPILRSHHDEVAPTLRAWACGEDLWLARTSIIAQLASKDATDRALLLDCVEANVDSREFFLAKAIGWALRQVAHLGPEPAQWVREVVAGYGDRMAPLARREALKHVGSAAAAL